MKPETIIGQDGKEVVLIHLERDGRIVCMPNMHTRDWPAQKERPAPHMRSDQIVAVTCPMCKRVVK